MISLWQRCISTFFVYFRISLCFCIAAISCDSELKRINLESGVAQLFVDDFLIESAENLNRTLNQPLKDFGGSKPVIALADEFAGLGATLEANGTIVYDPKLQKYIMIALGFSPEGRTLDKNPRWTFYRLYRFRSDDGIHWIKGDDGNPQWVFPRSEKDLFDPVSGTSATNIDAFSYYYDVKDDQYPYKGWQHFANWGGDREGHYLLKSRDGIHWERGPLLVNGYAGKQDAVHRKINQDGRNLVGPGDVTIFYHDQTEDRFLGIFKFYSPDPVENENRLRSRAYVFFSHPLSEPFDIQTIEHIELLPPAADKNNDGRYDEYYGSTAWRYESMWLGGLKIWHGGGDYSWSAAGCAYLKLVSSRDGLKWKKVPFVNNDGIPEVFIANGLEGGNQGQNDGGYITEFSQAPLKIGDELIFYYGSSSYGKNHPNNIRISGGGIFRARLRIDGFVSVGSGTLTTKILTFSGEDLYLNAVGPVTVEVLEAGGNLLGSQTISGDELKHHVLFAGQTLSQIAGGANIRLRFHVGQDGKLFSFTIHP